MEMKHLNFLTQMVMIVIIKVKIIIKKRQSSKMMGSLASGPVGRTSPSP